MTITVTERSLEVKLPTIWTDVKHRWEESGKSREEERRSEKRKSEKKEDAGARKGRKVTIHCLPPMMCSSGGSKSRLAKAAGAEPSGQMRYEKLHAVVARSPFPSQNAKNTPCSDHFWKLRCKDGCRLPPNSGNREATGKCCLNHSCTPLWLEALFQVKMYKTPQCRNTFGSWDVKKVDAVEAQSTFRSQNAQNTPGSEHFLKLRCQKSARRCSTFPNQKCLKMTVSDHFRTFRCRFAWQVQGIVHLVKSEQNLTVLQQFQKRWQAWDICRGSGKMHFAQQAQYKRHVHQRCWEVRALISWEGLHSGASDLQVCWHDFVWQVQHFVWPGITFSWQAQYIRQMEWKNCKTHWYEAVSSALNVLFLKDVSKNCFVFNVVNFENWKKSRRIASFLMLPTSKIEEVSQNCRVFDVVKLSSSKLRKSRRIASLSSLQIDR